MSGGGASPFSKHTFKVPPNTNRRTGPQETAVRKEYASAPPSVNSNLQVTNGTQIWTVPSTGKYQITARGAQGGSGSRRGSGGTGAVLEATFALNAGDTLHMLIGQEGRADRGTMVGGGGGTFVFTDYNKAGLLMVAGGGGGYGVGDNTSHQDNAHADPNGTAGKQGVGMKKTWVARNGSYTRSLDGKTSGGTNGAGGAAASSRGCGGGGWSGNGGGSSDGGGRNVKSGGHGYGGVGSGFQDGSFGGGGAVNMHTTYGACGGGGGYSGGGGAYSSNHDTVAAGGGGGSYLATDKTVSGDRIQRYGGKSGGNYGAGSVTVQFIPDTNASITSTARFDDQQMQDELNSISQNASADKVNTRLQKQKTKHAKADAALLQREFSQAGMKAGTDFAEVAHMTAELNASDAANRYISDELQQELNRINFLAQHAKNAVNAAQVQTLSLEYDIGRRRVMTRLVEYTLIASGALAAVVGMWYSGAVSAVPFYILAGIVAVLYTTVVMWAVANSTRRKKYHWSQWYWGNAGTKCAPKHPK